MHANARLDQQAVTAAVAGLLGKMFFTWNVKVSKHVCTAKFHIHNKR